MDAGGSLWRLLASMSEIRKQETIKGKSNKMRSFKKYQ
jgi:hypothetical protein